MSVIGHGPLQGFKVAPKSAGEIAGLASRVRKLFGVSGPEFNPERALESLTSYGVTLDVVHDQDSDLPRGVEACWLPDIVTLVVRESVYKAACAREPRAIFTVAHEIGHLALGHRRTFNRDSTNCKVYEDSEWQANTFAGEFLMPLDLIREKKAFTAERIAEIFGVSIQAAETRVSKLKKNGSI